ncbi:molybdopterin-binding protein [Phaeobacter sp. QD34_3]|uniref:molybdopterin-binding protein n=1 Tax=unclassified Phaeobacter TaxID=2621772 RepID=UPI00237F35CD|nr:MULTISPECIES: molybdopterin-binding protein [unclassified Phaeobacter]MDE4133628.1 molybdopterin-binding protein [Phaeobacter sp. QD34_3]MDE4137264.1 molybdopterin-binding protein [Phaeobacter sp. QD34_24]MDE4174088.1 molybdopterin-binding protein [Phaeobacter sp. PT47_59]
MRFGPVPLDQAEGAILAHSLQLKARKIAKGTELSAADLRDLAAEDRTEVIVARLEPGDLHEDAAAEALARAIVPDEVAQGLRISGAGAGRVNLYARTCGVVQLDRARLEAVNAVDPMISIATVPEYHRVDVDGMVATIKIIAYGVPEADLTQAAKDASGAMRVLAPVYRTATLIETRVSDETPSDKGRAAMAGRLDRMGMDLTDRVVVPHREAELSTAIAAAPGEVILVLTGSATSDPMDVAPQALRRAGGQVTRFGMPVDPGNLLFLGSFGDRPVIGLPGCARSPALNGADWVLERVISGVDVTSEDIAAMGVGGLLKEIPTRPMPRRAAPGGSGTG